MKRGSLAEERPELVAQWSSKNELSPSEVSCGSHKKVWWICNQGHSWEATIKNRALIGSKCPYCEHRAVLTGFNDLQTLFPEVAKTWSSKNELAPSEVSPSSNKSVLWICKNGHEWKARIADRTEGHGCPYCTGHKVWTGFNDLATTHPKLAAEWSEMNKSLSPDKITHKNRSNVWWHCSTCDNEYQAVVYTRANGSICPFCVANELKRIHGQRQAEKKIARDYEYLLPQLATIYYAGSNGLRVITDTEDPVGFPIMTLIPDIGLAIDVCSYSKELSIKKYICGVHNITYVGLPEGLSELDAITLVRKAFSYVHIHISSPVDEDLKHIKAMFTHWKQKA